MSRYRGRRRGDAEGYFMLAGAIFATIFFLTLSKNYVPKSEVVKRRFAHWKVDDNGRTEFRWMPSPARVELEEGQE